MKMKMPSWETAVVMAVVAAVAGLMVLIAVSDPSPPGPPCLREKCETRTTTRLDMHPDGTVSVLPDLEIVCRCLEWAPADAGDDR